MTSTDDILGTRKVAEPAQRLAGVRVEVCLAFGLPLAQHLDGVLVASSLTVDDPMVAVAQDQKVLERFTVLNISVAAGAGCDGRDDVRDLAHEYRLATLEDHHRFDA